MSTRLRDAEDRAERLALALAATERERDEATLARDQAEQDRKNASLAVVLAQEWIAERDAKLAAAERRAEEAVLERDKDRQRLLDAKVVVSAARTVLSSHHTFPQPACGCPTCSTLREAVALCDATTKAPGARNYGAERDAALAALAAAESERDALADRCAVAERACREEREARIAAERALYAEMEQDPATVLGRMRAERDAATSRASRYRLRLARVLRAATWAHNFHATEGGMKSLRPYGNVWSARALSGGKGEER